MRRLLVASVFFIISGAALAATVAGEETFTYLLVLFLHQLLFVFWLGPDIGIYMWSRKAVNPELTPAQRLAAGRIMTTIDIIPRVCMSLMLTVGGVLTELRGIDHPWWQMAGIWLLGPVWLTLTLLVYMRSASPDGARLRQLDNLFRWALLVGIPLSVAYSVITERLAGYPWVTAKLLLFAALVGFGLLLRHRLEPFRAALLQMAATGPSPELDKVMQRSLARGRTFLFASWLALAVAAGLGLAQPGGIPEGVADAESAATTTVPEGRN